MEIRIMLAVCVVAGSTLFGRSLSSCARRRVVVLDRLIRGTKMLRIHMSGMLENVSEALKLAGYEVFAEIGHEMEKGLSAKDAWYAKKPVFSKRCGPFDALQAKDTEVLDELFEHLGQSGRREQEVVLQSALKRLCEQRESAALQLSEKERLYVSVGFIIGLMLALVVI